MKKNEMENINLDKSILIDDYASNLQEIVKKSKEDMVVGEIASENSSIEEGMSTIQTEDGPKFFFDMDEVLFQYSKQEMQESYSPEQLEALARTSEKFKDLDVEIVGPKKVYPSRYTPIKLLRDEEPIELNALQEKKLNFGRKAQSLAARAHIPWEVAKEFIDGTETKAILKEKASDIELMAQMIISTYDKDLAHEIYDCGEKRQKKATIEIIGDKMYEKYGEATTKLIKAKVDSFNSSFVYNLSQVEDKNGLQEVLSNVPNQALISDEAIKIAFEVCIDMNDKDSYKKLFHDLTGTYVNNSALNYIFKEEVKDLSIEQILEFGKTMSAINNSNYSNEEKNKLKDMACDLLRDPQRYEINFETKTKTPIGFDTRKEDLLRRAIDRGIDFDRIEDMVERFEDVRGKDAYKIYKEESNKKYDIEF